MLKQMLVFVLVAALVMLGVSAMQAVADENAPTSAPASKPAGESKTWTGTAQRSGTHHRPQLMVESKRFELKAAEKAEDSVKETLKKISDGDTSKYTVKGTETTGDRGATIVVESITKVEPAQK
jgi:hypothetical protein